MKHLHLLYTFLLSALLFVSCDNISEEERLVYEKPEPAKRVVLLEDFTGQKCTNCPNANELIETLQNDFGDNLVVVGIHGGPLGFKGSAKLLGLATEVGDEYYTHWSLEYQPVGLINRQGATDFASWTTKINEEIKKPTTVNLSLVAATDGKDIDITTSVLGTEGETVGKLQVYVLEDSITAMQLMPDKTPNYEYVHNHVFRMAANGTWGEDITVEEGETIKKSVTVPLNSAWNKDNLSIVAFVYNDNGVVQAVKAKVVEAQP